MKYLILLIVTLFPFIANAQDGVGDTTFQILPITLDIQERITGKSYKQGCPVPLSSLRYLRVLHCDAEGNTRQGELVCNVGIAHDLIDIFRSLYNSGYRIEHIALVDDYDADDEKSMAANNTSCFNYRPIAGGKTLSKHSLGMAIDINPLLNPCVNTRTGKIEPAAGKPYAYSRQNKDKASLQMIDRNDLCYKLFLQHGFRWGGAWRSKKDYQHFEK